MLPSLLNITQINYPSVLKRVAISSGSGNLASTASVECSVSASLPYSISSKAANLVLSTLVESIVIEAVGFIPGTSTGVVVNSQENVIASGLSFTVL